MGAESKEELKRIQDARNAQQNKDAWARSTRESAKYDQKARRGNGGGGSGCILTLMLFISVIGLAFLF